MQTIFDNFKYKHVFILALIFLIFLAVVYYFCIMLLSGLSLYFWILFFTSAIFALTLYVAKGIFISIEKTNEKLDSILSKKSEQLLSKETYITKVLENTPNIILGIKDGKIIEYNKTFEALYPHVDKINHMDFCDMFEKDDGYFHCKDCTNIVQMSKTSNLKVKIKPNSHEKFFYLKLEYLDEEKNRLLAILSDITILESKMKDFEQIATTDTLTKIANRFQFEILFEQEIKNSFRYKLDLSLIFLDLDYFKNINDTFGHDIGDKTLIKVVDIIKKNIRLSDIFARWGGEEFVILLPATESYTAIKIAEKLRLKIEKEEFETIGNLTCSFGVTEFTEDDTKSTFIKRADTALYVAKRNGRNRVELEI